MACCQEVDLWVGAQDPEPVVLPPESLHASALGHVKDADALVLRIGDDQVLHPSRTSNRAFCKLCVAWQLCPVALVTVCTKSKSGGVSVS